MTWMLESGKRHASMEGAMLTEFVRSFREFALGTTALSDILDDQTVGDTTVRATQFFGLQKGSLESLFVAKK